MEERPAAASKAKSSRKHPHQQQNDAPAEPQPAEDPDVLKQQIYSQLKRSGIVASLKVSTCSLCWTSCNNT